MKPWCVYILRCGDGTLYTGWTNDLEKRVAAHNDGTGATNKAVTWSSSNPKVATVDSKGTVTGKAGGKCVITITTKDGGLTDTCDVIVEADNYTVSFDANGGEGVMPDMYCDPGKKYSLVANTFKRNVSALCSTNPIINQASSLLLYNNLSRYMLSFNVGIKQFFRNIAHQRIKREQAKNLMDLVTDIASNTIDKELVYKSIFFHCAVKS